jgi:hypothetical protein
MSRHELDADAVGALEFSWLSDSQLLQVFARLPFFYKSQCWLSYSCFRPAC